MPIKADKSLRAYYNEIDPYAAQWIRDLMAEGWITKGDVDERSIEDVRPNDLAGYDRLHFFAGVAVWDYALNQAGWGRSEIWTGSCPCQPFSTAGKGAGFADERHLWPHFHWLIEQCRPPIVLGEQVASKDGLAWLDLVSADLEGSGYTSGAVDTCAAGFGAPHIRQRLYWVGHAIGAGLERHTGHGDRAPGRQKPAGSVAASGSAGGLADARRALGQRGPDTEGLDGADPRLGFQGASDDQSRGAVGGLADSERLGHAQIQRQSGVGVLGGRVPQRPRAGFELSCPDSRPGPTNGFWRDADWLYCRDGRWRPVEARVQQMVDGAPLRVGRLRAYGNAINAAQAEGFIRAVMECASP